MSDYEFDLKAQQWSKDTYYVGSSATTYPMTVIASTKQEATDKATAVLGTPEYDYYWRFWVLNIREVQLLTAELCEVEDGAA